MPTNDYFAHHKTASLSGVSGRGRRVWHSLTNYVSSTDRTSFGFKSGTSLGGKEVLDAGAKAVGAGANVMGAVGVVALSALSSAAAIAALTGPQAAVTAGVVGIVLFAKSTYSNREAAHVELNRYCWSLIDDMPPTETFATPQKLSEAAGAALTLMDDGKNQIKLMAAKMASVTSEIEKLNKKLMDNETRIGGLSKDPAQRAATIASIDRIKRESQELIDKGNAQGGAIYNYVRRLVHMGNYFQAPLIIAMAMKEKHSPSSSVGRAFPDYFANTALGDASRRYLAELARIYTEILKPVDMTNTRQINARINQGSAATGTTAPAVRRGPLSGQTP